MGERRMLHVKCLFGTKVWDEVRCSAPSLRSASFFTPPHMQTDIHSVFHTVMSSRKLAYLRLPLHLQELPPCPSACLLATVVVCNAHLHLQLNICTIKSKCDLKCATY